MESSATLIAIVHILLAFFLVVIVLLQDSKGGNVGGAFGGGSSQSIFGATGAASFLVKLTRYLAVGFMVTCILLTIVSARTGTHSVTDKMRMTPSSPAVPAAPQAPQAPPAQQPAK